MEIVKGKLNRIYPVGKQLYGDIVADKRTLKQVRLSKKSLWALLRQHFTYKVNAEFKEYKGDFVDFAEEKLDTLKETKKVQFILNDDEDFSIAVATLKHTEKGEDYVYDLIKKILRKRRIAMVEEHGISGRVFYMRSPSPKFQVGVQVSGGDLATMKAIKITPFAKIKDCLNPLSWLGIEKMWYSEEKLEIMTIRRFEKTSLIEKRISTILKKSVGIAKKVNIMLENGKKVQVSKLEARKLLLVMCKSYGIGLKAVQKIYKRWLKKEKKSMYGLAMACSYYSAHGKVFKKSAKYSSQNISSIAGALLIIKKTKIVKVITKKLKENKDLKDELEEIEG